MLFMVFVVLCDIVYDYTVKIAEQFKISIKREDMIFLIFFISAVIWISFNLKYRFIEQFIGIVDYDNAQLSVMRVNIILFFLIIYGLLNIIIPFICRAIAFRNNMDYRKWFCYGFFLNILALIYLISIIKKQKDKVGHD